jgi:hypothetical protein
MLRNQPFPEPAHGLGTDSHVTSLTPKWLAWPIFRASRATDGEECPPDLTRRRSRHRHVDLCPAYPKRAQATNERKQRSASVRHVTVRLCAVTIGHSPLRPPRSDPAGRATPIGPRAFAFGQCAALSIRDAAAAYRGSVRPLVWNALVILFTI